MGGTDENDGRQTRIEAILDDETLLFAGGPKAQKQASPGQSDWSGTTGLPTAGSPKGGRGGDRQRRAPPWVTIQKAGPALKGLNKTQ